MIFDLIKYDYFYFGAKRGVPIVVESVDADQLD